LGFHPIKPSQLLAHVCRAAHGQFFAIHSCETARSFPEKFRQGQFPQIETLHSLLGGQPLRPLSWRQGPAARHADPISALFQLFSISIFQLLPPQKTVTFPETLTQTLFSSRLAPAVFLLI
jgi:hypothetical protein